MEKNREKELEVLLKNTILEIGLETPSTKFTEQLLSKIQLDGLKSGTPEKSLISKRTWGLLLAGITGVSSYLLLGGGKMETTWEAPYSRYGQWLVHYFDFTSKMHLSDTLIYGLAGLSIFLCIQILVLKQHFNKRYSI